MSHPLTPELVDLVADRFKALAEPLRLSILNVLRAGECTVGELVDALDSSHANISKHLQVLHAAGFVSRRKDGLHVHYSLADRNVFKLCDLMCGRLDAELKTRKRTLRR